MTHWWEIGTPDPNAVPKFRGVAYYRHSAQDRQENSIPLQRDQVRQWADENGVEIIHEFADAGKSGLNSEGRPAFNEMMDEWVKKRSDFDYVLCLDVSCCDGRVSPVSTVAPRPLAADLRPPRSLRNVQRGPGENRPR